MLRGGRPGRTVALRADMDALPVAEIADHDYQSQNPGLMHACGHDGHMAILMGTARDPRRAARHAAPAASCSSSSPRRRIRPAARR